MTSHQKSLLLLMFCLICILSAGCLQTDRLLLESQGLPERSIEIGNARIFSLHYTHSVEKTPVIEIFQILDDGRFMLVSTKYKSYGVGLPSLPEEGKLTVADGWFVLENIQREYRDIRLRVGYEAAVELEVNNKKNPIFQWYPNGSLVIIRGVLGK